KSLSKETVIRGLRDVPTVSHRSGRSVDAQGRYLGDPDFEPLWAELDTREAAVFVHPTQPPTPCLGHIPDLGQICCAMPCAVTVPALVDLSNDADLVVVGRLGTGTLRAVTWAR